MPCQFQQTSQRPRHKIEIVACIIIPDVPVNPRHERKINKKQGDREHNLVNHPGMLFGASLAGFRKMLFFSGCGHGTIVQHSAHAAHYLCVPLCPLRLKPPTLPNSNLPEAEATNNQYSVSSGGHADFRTVFWRTVMVSDTTDLAWCQAPFANRGLVSGTR